MIDSLVHDYGHECGETGGGINLHNNNISDRLIKGTAFQESARANKPILSTGRGDALE